MGPAVNRLIALSTKPGQRFTHGWVPIGDGSPGTRRPSVSYTVKKGDTLSGIAAKGLTPASWHDIAEFNSIKDPNMIQPGQVLKIPRDKNSEKGFQAVEKGDRFDTPKKSRHGGTPKPSPKPKPHYGGSPKPKPKAHAPQHNPPHGNPPKPHHIVVKPPKSKFHHTPPRQATKPPRNYLIKPR